MKARRVDFYPDDWLAGTNDLGPNEGWVYCQIVQLIYSRGGPIVDDETWLSGVCNMHWRSFRISRLALLRRGKIVSKDGHISVRRCARELQKARKRASRSVQNGRTGGRPRKKNNGLENPWVAATETLARTYPSPSPSPSPIEEPDADASGERARPAPGANGRAANGRETRKTRIAADCEPGDEHFAYAAEHGYDARWVIAEFAKFRDHHLAKGTLCADWLAAWRTWVQRAPGFERPPPGGGRARSGGILAAVRAVENRGAVD